MLQAFRGRHIGLGLLLMTISWGLFGCAQGLDVPMGTTESSDSALGVYTQGVKFDEELLGSGRQAALEQALGDWKVQGMRSLLESDGRSLDLGNIQAFSFERGSHQGTLVLLPFGDELLFYLQFRDSNRIMLTAHRPGVTLRAVNDSQERKDLLQEMQSKGAFRWLEEELGKRSRLLVPGETLLLKDDSRGQVVFFVFAKPKKVNPSEVSSQIVKLDPGVDGDAAGEIYLGDGTTSSSTAELDPGTGAGFAISGTTRVSGTTLTGTPFFSGSHRTVSSEPTASVTVRGELTSEQYQPSGSAVTTCSNGGRGSTSCGTFFQVGFCPSKETIIANGSGTHTGTFQEITLIDESSGSASVNCP